MPVVHVEDVAFAYPVGGFELRAGNLALGAGETLALIGPSGSGKTTLLNLLAGILLPDRGRVEVAGEVVSELEPEDRQDYRLTRMGLVFQEFELLDYLDVLDNVLLPYRISPVLELDEAVRQRARELCEAVGLGEKRHRFPDLLSQGERQRVAVCRALVTEPRLVLGDEPTGNLDPESRDRVMDLLFEFRARSHAPVVVVTHDTELVERFDRRVDVRELAS